MKRICILTLVLIMLLSILSSCAYVNKPVNIDGVSKNLTVQEFKGGYTITFDGVSYVPANKDGLYFYRQSGEPVAHYWGQLGISSINTLPHRDFGITFTICNLILGDFFGTSCPYISEYIILPELESIVTQDIVYVWDDGFTNNYTYHELSSHEDLRTQKISTVLDHTLWHKAEEIVLLGDIIDFDETLTFNEEFTVYSNDFVFIPEQYSSFICGPFNLVEANNELYMMLDEADAKIMYKVQYEYQEIFKNAIEQIYY